MARKYPKGASKKVARAMRKRKRGTLKSGRSGKTVRSRKQAIAIGLSEARKEGKKVPKKKIVSRSEIAYAGSCAETDARASVIALSASATARLRIASRPAFL